MTNLIVPPPCNWSTICSVWFWSWDDSYDSSYRGRLVWRKSTSKGRLWNHSIPMCTLCMMSPSSKCFLKQLLTMSTILAEPYMISHWLLLMFNWSSLLMEVQKLKENSRRVWSMNPVLQQMCVKQMTRMKEYARVQIERKHYNHQHQWSRWHMTIW